MLDQEPGQNGNQDGASEGFIGDRRRFARDVLTNVLANLIAAAIIYLGAVAAGYVSATVWLVAVSVGIAAGGLVLYFVLIFGVGAWATRRGLGVEVFAVAATVLAVGSLARLLWQPDEQRAPGSEGVVIGFGALALGAIVHAWFTRRDRRRVRHDQ